VVSASVASGSVASADVASGAAQRVRDICEAVPDPEFPVLSIGDLGMVRNVTIDATGRVEVALTPTYSGCPATDVIRDDVRQALKSSGFADVVVRTVLAPAWTSDWISEAGRRKLAAAEIAPPPSAGGPVDLRLGVRCPHCGSVEVGVVSRFGTTPCRAICRCTSCGEPFDLFKPH
jgi:ring-1,2-phenylacetyl-CoA epoxidase subunit PaaD